MTIEHRALFDAQLGGPVLAFDVDWACGRVVAVVDGAKSLVRMTLRPDGLRRDPDFGEELELPEGAASGVALHPTANIVATAGWNRPVRLWDLEGSPRWLRDLGEAGRGRRRGSWGVSWSVCGSYLDTHNLALGRGERFEWQSGRRIAERWGHDGPFIRHPCADLLALAVGAEASTVHFGYWDGDVARWLPVAIDLFVPCKLAFGPRALAAVGGSSRVHAAMFVMPSLRPRFARKLDSVDESVAAEFGVSQAVALAPDGATLYVPGGDGEVVALDGTVGAERGRWRAHSRMVTQLAHHPDSGLILSAGLDGRLVLSAVPMPGPDRTTNKDAEGLVLRYPPTPVDPDGLPGGTVTIIDTPW